MTFDVTIIYDFYDDGYRNSQNEPDVQYHDFTPDQSFRVTNVRLKNEEPFRLGEEQFYDPFPGWQDGLNNPPDHSSISTHRLKYDANKIAEDGVVVRGFATYEVRQKDNENIQTISIPTPTGLACDYVEIRFGTQIFKIYQTAPNIQTIYGGSIFKAVHLDTALNAEDYTSYTINQVILFVSPVTQDGIIEAWAHYVPASPALSSLSLEDLQTLNFSTYSELTVKSYRYTEELRDATFATFFIEDKTGDYLDSPLGHRITSGLIFYWPKLLPNDGLMAEVFVEYNDDRNIPGYGTRDIKVLSISVPTGWVSGFDISGIVPLKLYYIDDLGFIITHIDTNLIKTLEIHFDGTQLGPGQTFVEVIANYVHHPLGLAVKGNLLSFSGKQFWMVKAEFEGMTPKRLFYDTDERGILEAPLPTPMKVTNVLVEAEPVQTKTDGIEVSYTPTYLAPLKQVKWPIRSKGDKWVVDDLTPTGAILQGVYAVGEFDKYANVLQINGYRSQRISSVETFYYDTDLSVDEGTDFSMTIDVQEPINSRFGPFIPGSPAWLSPTGNDEQYRIDMKGTTINRIEVVGVTTSQAPIMIERNGFRRPYVLGEDVVPDSVLLYYSQITSVAMYYDMQLPIYKHPSYNQLLQDSQYWKSATNVEDETIDLTPTSGVTFNQLIVMLSATSDVPTSITMRLIADLGEEVVKQNSITQTTLTATAPVGSVQIEVTDTTGYVVGQVLQIGDAVAAIEYVDSSTVIGIEPLSATVLAGARVLNTGFELEKNNSYSRVFVVLKKDGASKSFEVERLSARVSSVQYQPLPVRNVLDITEVGWAPAAAEGANSESFIRLRYERPIGFNRIQLEQDVELLPEVTVYDSSVDQPRPVFLARDTTSYGDVFIDQDAVDEPWSSRQVVKAQTIIARFTESSFSKVYNGFGPMVRKFIPQMVTEEPTSLSQNIINNKLTPGWKSAALSSSADTDTFILDLGGTYKIDRLGIATQTPGANVKVYASLGPSGYSLIATIADIGAPASTVTQALTADAGASQPNPKRVLVASTANFIKNRYVRVTDSASSTGEARKIAAIGAGYLDFDIALTQDYTVANSAQVKQSNILCPGTILPYVSGQACLGPDVLGPSKAQDAFALPLTDARYVKLVFSNVPVGTDGFRILRISCIDIYRLVVMP